MIDHIQVYSIEAIQLLINASFRDPLIDQFDNFFVLSIIDRLPSKMTFPGAAGCLTLHFKDIDAGDARGAELFRKGGHVVFDVEHALKVHEFLETINRVDGRNILLVHCTAGCSRSGAVALYACDRYGLNLEHFVNSNPQIRPNSWVLRVLDIKDKTWDDFQKRKADLLMCAYR